MNSLSIKKRDKQSIYEIFRACRLCGAGGGYKMPIIQNIVDLGANELKLKEKIKECVQIDVQPDDKMPPLICEMCLDKINEFHDFIQLCQVTNTRARSALGLPLKANNNNLESECILGKLSPICDHESDDEPLENRVKKKKKVEKISKIVEKTEKPKATKRPLSPPPKATKRPVSPPPEAIEKPKPKRLPVEPSAPTKSTPPPPAKKTKISPKPVPKSKKKVATPAKEPECGKPKKVATPSTKESECGKPKKVATPSVKESECGKPKKVATPAAKEYECRICKMKFKSLGGHMRSHDVLFTEMRLSCRPCAEWFLTIEEANTHHNDHKSLDRPYRCRRCSGEFTFLKDYDDHVVDYCPAYFETEPDLRCESCWNEFPTQPLYDQHNCLGEDGRPGGECSKCRCLYPLLKELQEHEPTCNRLKYGDILATVELDVLKSLREAQIRFSRCDKLLLRAVGDSYDVSRVTPNHDLDKQKVYPYKSQNQGLEPEPNAMVKIPSLNMEDYDSLSEIDIDVNGAKVKSLSNLCLTVVEANKSLSKTKSHSDFEEIDEQKDMDTNFDDLINNLNDDGDDNNDKVDDKNDVPSKSSLEEHVSNVKGLDESILSESASNSGIVSEKNNESANNGTQVSEEIKDKEVIDSSKIEMTIDDEKQ